MIDHENPQIAHFDLQSHSTVSDGVLPPAEVVARAAAAGIELLALTDHDAVDGVDEALEAAREHGVRLVPAAELSTVDGEHEDLHVVGYCLEHRDPALLEALREFRADREARVGRMAQALRELGLAVEMPDRGGRPIGRPHLAAAAHAEPANRARLEAEGLRTPTDLLVAYLIPGAPAYRRRTTPTVAEAIALIHDTGGVAVWAHPFWDVDRDEEALEAIERFAQAGLDGVEAFYITHTQEQTELLARVCAERGLLSTGSADFHGPEHPHFHAFGAFETYGLEPELGPIGAWPRAST
ncbi:MAG TPA: PHP domain-containing protein [Solirubrobacteraceae bacterium]|nr:PHP domain-containing protein [Solirubrobacteraceae bacterium]